MIRLDRRVEAWIVAHRVGALDHPFVWLSATGVFGLVWIVLGAVVAVALRRLSVFLLVVVADVLADLAASGLQAAVGRPRPDETHRLVEVSSFSFPSGHAATSFACALVLASFVPRLAVAFFALATLMAFSRLYLGVHYPLDVLGGGVLGLATATTLLLLAPVRRRSRADLR